MMEPRTLCRADQSVLKVLYLFAVRQHNNRQDLSGRMTGLKSILNTLHIHYGDWICWHA